MDSVGDLEAVKVGAPRTLALPGSRGKSAPLESTVQTGNPKTAFLQL